MAETMDKLRAIGAIIFGGRKDSEHGVGLQRPVTKEMESYDKVAIRYDRQSVIQTCTLMAATDVRVARVLQKMASDSVVGGMNVKVEMASSDGVKDQAQEIIDAVMDDCRVIHYLKGWTLSCLKEGDLFWELVVDDKERKITRLKKLAAVITMSNMDSGGNFPKEKPAYYQEHPLTRQEIKTFEPWQICHVKWQEEDGKPYGTPIFAPARLSWERLDASEKNIVIRRGVRAGITRQHKIGSADRPGTWEEVNQYKDEVKDTAANPMDASQDFYSPGNIDIIELSGDTTLGDMEDIKYFEGQLTMVAGVPYALLSGGRESAINRDVLEEQEEDYFRVISDVNSTLEGGLRKVFDFALLLGGVNDESIAYTFRWGAKDRDDIDAKIDRALNLQKLGFSFDTIFNTVDLEGVTLEEEVDRIAEQVEEGKIPYGVGMKLDPAIVQLLAGVSAAGKNGDDTKKLEESLRRLGDIAERELGGDDQISMNAKRSLLTLQAGG